MAATSQASKQERTAAGTGPARKKKRPKLYGKEKPRVYTPALHQLEPRSPEAEEWTLGYDVIDFAEQVLKVNLFPWQKWLLVHMLELLEDGQLRFRTVVVLIARQNGKSTLSQVLALWIICVWGWPLVLGTAQDLETAEEVWQGAVDMVEESEELAPLIDKVVKVNGKKALEIIRDVEEYKQTKRVKTRYKVKAANRKAGRGFTGNLILLDELREHQNWDAWGAITKTTMAQLEALILALSNAGDVTSVVLRHLRRMGHEGAGDPDGICKSGDELMPDVIDLGMEASSDEDEDDEWDDEDDWELEPESLGLFEWSAPPGCSKWDRDGWAQANPSVGWNPGFTERTLVAACKTDPEWVYRTECMCQWSDGILEGPFAPGVWEEGQNVPEVGPDGTPQVAEADQIVSEVTIGLAQSSDREYVYMARAGYRADGKPQVELVAARHGTSWTFDYMMHGNRRKRIRAVTGQSKGAQVSALMEDLAEAKSDPNATFDVPVEPWQGTDLTNGWSRFMDAVNHKTLRHHKQPPLDLSATTAVLKTFSGGATLPDEKASPAGTAPLMAAVAAYWLLTRKEEHELPPPPPPAAVSAAEVQAATPTESTGLGGWSGDIGSVGF